MIRWWAHSIPWKSNPLDPPQKDDDDDDNDNDDDEEEEEEKDADEGEDETVQPMDFDPLNPPPKKIDFITQPPPLSLTKSIIGPNSAPNIC